ncbi:MAG: hypothetical protein ACYCWW_14975 [Deltaproteobacteria bacterium]
MDAKSKLFRSLVLGGAALTLGPLGCGGYGTTPTGGTTSGGGSDAGQVTDAGTGGGTDGGNCTCTKDPAWPGNDCGPTGGTSVCCWLHPTAQCCP